MMMQGYTFFNQTIFHHMRLMFIEYIAPISITTQQIMNLHSTGDQSLGQL